MDWNMNVIMAPDMEIQLIRKQTGDYQVNVPVFMGPLDLLLQLIEQSELEITSVSLAMVTDQYLQYIHQMEDIAADEISGFLVISAKLIQIKSEALLPRPSIIAAEDDDPGLSLIQQLQVYKKFKEVSLWLQERETKGLRNYLRYAPLPKLDSRLDIGDLTVNDLMLAAEEVLQNIQDKQNLGTVIKAQKITIREKISLITGKLKKGEHISFRNLISQSDSRLEIVVTFLALLELIKRFHVKAIQDDIFSDIKVEPTGDFSEDTNYVIEFGE